MCKSTCLNAYVICVCVCIYSKCSLKSTLLEEIMLRALFSLSVLLLSFLLLFFFLWLFSLVPLIATLCKNVCKWKWNFHNELTLPAKCFAALIKLKFRNESIVWQHKRVERVHDDVKRLHTVAHRHKSSHSYAVTCFCYLHLLLNCCKFKYCIAKHLR